MERDHDRLRLVAEHIRRIKAADYPVTVGAPGNYRIEERPWNDLAEPSKLAILQGAVDWSGVSDRDQAHILLAEIDPGKITDARRNRLIDVATKALDEILDMKPDVALLMSRDREREGR